MNGKVLFIFAILLVSSYANLYKLVPSTTADGKRAVGKCPDSDCGSGETCCDTPDGPGCCPGKSD